MGVSITQSIQPTQRGLILYGDGVPVPAAMKSKSSLVVIGRAINNPGREDAAAAGAIVPIYLDATMWANLGTYHNMFFNAGTIDGVSYAAVGSHPRGGNSYGPPVNFNSTIAVAKYEAVLRRMVADNPWCNAIFCDDQGPDWVGYNTFAFTQSTYGGQLVMTAADKEAARTYQIGLAQAARRVADEFGLILICNGHWAADGQGGGYPNRGVHGCSLYDIFCIEHHTNNELAYWIAVGGGQWRLRDPQGQRLMFIIANDQASFDGYRNQQHFSHLCLQTTPNYTSSSPNIPAGLTPHDLGVIGGRGGTPTTTVTVTPATADVQTGGTVQFSAAVSPAGGTISWSVNDIAGGNSTVGTITSGGLYTAPGAVPQGGTVTVRATHTSGANDSSPVTVSTSTPPPPPAELPPPPAIPNKALGNRFVGLIPNDMSPDYARGVVVVAPPEDGLMDALVLGCDGGGAGTATQPYTLRVYSVDSQGVGGALRGSTAERSIVSADAPAWARSAFASQVAFTANEVLLLVIHSGGTQSTGRFFRNDSQNASRGIFDTYSDGGIASFSAAAVGAADISIYAEYTPVGVAGAALAGALHLDFAMAGDARATAVGGSIVDPDLVLQRNRYELRVVPVSEFFLNLGDGVPGARLIWQASDGTFRFLDEQ